MDFVYGAIISRIKDYLSRLPNEQRKRERFQHHNLQKNSHSVLLSSEFQSRLYSPNRNGIKLSEIILSGGLELSSNGLPSSGAVKPK